MFLHALTTTPPPCQNPCVLHVRPLSLNAKINPSDNQAHPDLDIYSLLFLWRPGHLFWLLTYGLLKQRLSHPKHSWLFTFALAVGALGGLGKRGRAKMGCRDISVTPWTVQDLWKKVWRRFKRVLHAALLSKQTLSDSGGCRSSTCAGEMPTKTVCFWEWSKIYFSNLQNAGFMCETVTSPSTLTQLCSTFT